MTHLMRLSSAFPFSERMTQLMSFPTLAMQHPPQPKARYFRTRTRSEPLSYHLEESSLEYTLTLCVPGLAPEVIEITTESDQLNITLKPSTQNEGPQAQWFHEGVERPIAGQSFRLPTDADREIISAKLDRGILKITIPRIEKAPPRVIPVDASGYGDH